MTILFNDKPICLTQPTMLAQLLEQRNITPAGTAVALNGSLVAPTLWDATALSDGDYINVFKAFYGG